MPITYGKDITYDEYSELRELVKWAPVSKRKFDIAYPNTLFQIVAHDGDKIVSVARVIGDGGYHLDLCDVMVRPEYQGQGIGREMVNRVLEYVDSITELGEETMIILVAAKGKEPFYKKFGFIERPTEDRGAGMYIYYTKENENG